MSVSARFLAENPDQIVFTMKLTMTAKEWCELRDDLENGKYTSSQLKWAITDLLLQARKTFYPQRGEEDEN